MFEDKTADARVRRKAKRVGWRVEKSRTRLVHHNDRGMYQLIDDRNCICGGADYDASLPDIEAWIDTELTAQR